MSNSGHKILNDIDAPIRVLDFVPQSHAINAWVMNVKDFSEVTNFYIFNSISSLSLLLLRQNKLN